MEKKNKGKNYLATKQIIEMLKWSYNNKDANFLYMGFYDWSGVLIKFPETDKMCAKDAEHVIIASNVETFIETMIAELAWQYEEYEKDEEYVFGCDIGVAHGQDIKEDVKDNYKKFSKFIYFDTKEEMYNFAEEVVDEVRDFINEQAIKSADSELEITADRLKTIQKNEDLVAILSEEDKYLLEGMPEKVGKLNVYVTKNEKTNKKELIVKEDEFVM